jgi:CheY-like chemotaxis protein
LRRRVVSVNHRILWIDDDEIVGRAMRRLLEGIGYSVTVVTDPVKAVEHFRADPSQFDIVVSDYTMPVKNGIQVAHEAHAIRPDIPILLLTGDVAIFDTVAGDPAFREVIAKPVTRADIAAAIGRCLDAGGKSGAK